MESTARVAARSRVHHTVIEADARLPIRLSEIWDYRELLWRLSARDVTIRYRQTALGVSWVLLQPLISAAIFAILFGAIGHFPSEGRPYFVLALAGMVAWTFFTTLVTRASIAVVDQIQLVTKVFFPRVLLPLSVTGAALIDLAVGVVAVAVSLTFTRSGPGAPLLLLPLWILVLFVGGSGLGLISASLAVKYRDVRHILPVLMQLLLFASPVAYGLNVVSGRYGLLFIVNPLSGVLEAFKWSLTGSAQPNALQVSYSAAAAIVIFGIGVAVFSRREREFADVI